MLLSFYEILYLISEVHFESLTINILEVGLHTGNRLQTVTDH